MLNTILFDLDGTLLPMDMDAFEKLYFGAMSAYLGDLISPKDLVNNIWASTKTMVSNLEYRTNEEVFMEDFNSRITGNIDIYKERFDKFYDTEFFKAKEAVQPNEFMRKSVDLLKAKGYELIIATNPLFPLKAIHHRIEWAGFKPSEFKYITHYEKNHYCKPQVKYYEEILSEIKRKPEECMMVGNDVQEDLIASELGIKTFLIKDCLLHRTNEEIISDYDGNYEDFYNFVETLPSIK
ncbi:HAD family hydrolase [Clostridium sp. YIM B02515]|uniref:HAD family hydrolase n=1 Tax=Clostridium rhizosphaerae TaxID=2803861 RepID=A0ABS1TBZ6_9CLOT|nr:HAD family hydrolase [Clostridium rhizosphaerae]MBL4936888.1 HAD family hydrolase [Clostridium rhizosphaerae]